MSWYNCFYMQMNLVFVAEQFSSFYMEYMLPSSKRLCVQQCVEYEVTC